ncbi:hypothetical protein TrVE_jg13127 [Triparma verrucosa]|uniref:RRM domain-containing protein n=1 Tax=Triparma verrucosa TaxID=1606542 RepID=A0A9W7CJJ5_9STRA|nr:hypothetical protein TrVE_jg13127 [Triparma verrucosa]
MKMEDELDSSIVFSVAFSFSLSFIDQGLPYTSSSLEITSFFKSHSYTLTELRLPTWQDNPSRLRGFGHIVFESDDQAARALKKLSGKQLPNSSRYITLKPAHLPKSETHRPPRTQPNNCTSIHVRNLPYTITSSEIESVFKTFGKITPNGIRLPLNSSSKPKGFCYVTYLSSSSCYSAVMKGSKPYGIVVGGRPVFVDYEEKGVEGVRDSFKTEDGKSWNKEFKNVRKKGEKEES